jgi:hypothetical protein
MMCFRTPFSAEVLLRSFTAADGQARAGREVVTKGVMA